jgi:Zn-dependent peptidase ImmA (M78 family)/O-acetyl-ADP-ribose deacetylase (regulator of RNase III)
MNDANNFRWTNKSVLALAAGEDPITTIERRARELVLHARDEGWNGPPFNPIFIADLLKIPVTANANVADACIVSVEGNLQIQFNPTQVRERVRFSIAHEIAHSLFADVADEVRNRGGKKEAKDDWQLELLCNLAASEFVMPIGSISARERLVSLENLMVERRKFDVSAEAFLIRVTKIANEPVVMFCASAESKSSDDKAYRVDYSVASASAPHSLISGFRVPKDSIVNSCTAIGFTNRGIENWFGDKKIPIECVGIPGYPGANSPRVAGLIRFSKADMTSARVNFVHGDVLKAQGSETRVICQLVNDQARSWGGGVARSAAKAFPAAHRDFSNWITSLPKNRRLGDVHFAQTNQNMFIASLVGQEGFGPSPTPRIRYAALEKCLAKISDFASSKSASVHMPRIGSGESGGSWDTVQEMVQDTLIADGIPVTVYDLPPKRLPNPPGLFD